MNKRILLSSLFFAAALAPCAVWAQGNTALHVVRSDINAESENAELCLEFDKPLTGSLAARLSAALHLEADGKNVEPKNIAATGTSLCLFPLERGASYHLDVAGLRGEGEGMESKSAPYALSFTIPDRSPTLAFTADNGGVNGFGSYDEPMNLRAVNVASAKIEIYRIADPVLMARIWQDRDQTALAPSESAYLARDKGQRVWQGENNFDAAPNATVEQKFSLRDKAPNLTPGLYLMIADAGGGKAKPADKGLAPLAATWFTKSDFVLRAVRDGDGVHVFASKTGGGHGGKNGLSLISMNKELQQVAQAQGTADGTGLMQTNKNDAASVIATDKDGNVAFADIESLPSLFARPALGTLRTSSLWALPGENTTALLSLPPPENAATPSVLRLSHGDAAYADFAVPAATAGSAKMAFTAPPVQGAWILRWQKSDGTLIADAPLRVTANGDAPHLDVTGGRDALTAGEAWPVTIKSLASSGSAVPLVGGTVRIEWQKLDPASIGWKDYRFGVPADIAETNAPIAGFVTDLQGTAALRLTLPPHPPERGLYQAVLQVTADADAGVTEATPLTLPLKPDATVVGIKPLASEARFPQNGIARFAIVALSSDGKARDMPDLSYQVYEEGRNFDWYQDEGRWKYRPEPQLRPIGGGALSIRADGGGLEWPVTAGNYRLEILDGAGKTLAQTDFSAGWDSAGAPSMTSLPLNVTMPKTLQPGREAVVHVMLPEPAMLTAIVADTRIRKSVHEFRAKGDNTITFTPGADWPKKISLSVEALPQEGWAIPLRAVVEAGLEQGRAGDSTGGGLAVVATDAPQALMLRKDNAATLSFAVENNGDATETYHYAFTASPGLKIEDAKGSLTLEGRQSKALTLPLEALQAGDKELRLEITGTHRQNLTRSWALAVLPKEESLRSGKTATVAPKAPMLAVLQDGGKETPASFVFVSRRPMDGLAEILSYVFTARPFTTAELSFSIDALRLWSDTLAQAGIAPDFLIAARRQEQLMQLLKRQNADGGFSPLRNGNSTIEATAAALTALGPDASALAKPAKILAIGWIKQQLSNTWFDEKERAPRAEAYAALAAADAVDAASLHYFSDTSAGNGLPQTAEANMAAAFRNIHAYDASAFWIKKVQGEKKTANPIPLLNALAATDALPSGDVQAAMAKMAVMLRRGAAPSLADAAALLRAVAVDAANAGKGHLTNGHETRDVSGVLALRANDVAAALYRNADAQPLSVTAVAATKDDRPVALGSAITRHVYRMSGAEMTAAEKLVRGDIYMVELKGRVPALGENEHAVAQDGGSALRPLGCPVPSSLDALSFVPWFSPHGQTSVGACEFLPHEIGAVLATKSGGGFEISYFARIDTDQLSSLPPPRLRVLK